MPSALLALSLTVVITSALSAQSEERPAIFAPRPIAPETTGPGAAAPERPVARAATSDRMRLLLTERVLAAAKAFDAPQPAAGSETAAQPPTTAGPDGAVLMRQFFVRALPLRRDQVEPRAVPLGPHRRHLWSVRRRGFRRRGVRPCGPGRWWRCPVDHNRRAGRYVPRWPKPPPG